MELPAPTFEAALYSEGVSKGLTQTSGPQAVLTARSGALAASYKNIDTSSGDGEFALSGRHRARALGLDWEGRVIWKTLANPADDADAWEFVGSVSKTFGPLAASVQVVWSPDDLGRTEESTFTEVGLSWEKGRATWSVNAGRRDRSGSEYESFDAGVAYTVTERLELDLRYFDSSVERGRVIAGVRLAL